MVPQVLPCLQFFPEDVMVVIYVVISLSLWLSWSQAASAAQPTEYICYLKYSSEERSPAKTKKLDLHFPQRNSDWASLWLKNVLYLDYWKHACPKGMHFRIWVVHALTPNQALASQTGNCLKLMGNQWMLDKLVISCYFWTTDNSNGSPTSFPKHLTPGFPYAWATLVVFFLKSCREHQVITQIPVETCYLSYLSTLEQSSSTNKITPRTIKNLGPEVVCIYVLCVACSYQFQPKYDSCLETHGRTKQSDCSKEYENNSLLEKKCAVNFGCRRCRKSVPHTCHASPHASRSSWVVPHTCHLPVSAAGFVQWHVRRAKTLRAAASSGPSGHSLTNSYKILIKINKSNALELKMAVQISCQFHPLVHWQAGWQGKTTAGFISSSSHRGTGANLCHHIWLCLGIRNALQHCSIAHELIQREVGPSIDIDAQCFSQANLLCVVLNPWYQAIKTCLKPSTHHTRSYQDFTESHWAHWAHGSPMLCIARCPNRLAGLANTRLPPWAGFAGALACCRKGNPAKTSASW